MYKKEKCILTPKFDSIELKNDNSSITDVIKYGKVRN